MSTELYRITFARTSKATMTVHATSAEQAAEVATRRAKSQGWRATAIRLVERQGWVTAIDHFPAKHYPRRPR